MADRAGASRSEHFGGVEWVDRRVGLGTSQKVLEGELLQVLAELSHGSNVPLDDQAGVFLVEFVVAIVFMLVEKGFPDVEPFAKLRGCHFEVGRLVGLRPFVEELAGFNTFGCHLGHATIFPVPIIHLVGPAIRPVLLGFVELVEPIGIGDVVETNLVLRGVVERLVLVVAELLPLVECPEPLLLGDFAERGFDPDHAHLLKSDGIARLSMGRHGAEREITGTTLALGHGVDVVKVGLDAGLDAFGTVVDELDRAGEPAVTELEVVVADDEVANAIQVISNVARTGQIGDGKIFVTNLADVVRIRTGETGPGAI